MGMGRGKIELLRRASEAVVALETSPGAKSLRSACFEAIAWLLDVPKDVLFDGSSTTRQPVENKQVQPMHTPDCSVLPGDGPQDRETQNPNFCLLFASGVLLLNLLQRLHVD